MALSNSVRLDDPYPTPVSRPLDLAPGTNSEPSDVKVGFDDGVMKIEHGDGSVTIDFDAIANQGDEPEDKSFEANLANKLGDGRLSEIAEDLLQGIKTDVDSRSEWLETRATGIKLLGLRIEKARAPGSDTPMEGMSTVRHPLLLEATVKFQATARAELLPSSGPVKVRNDSPMPPRSILLQQNQLQQTSALSQLADSLQTKDDLAQALEKDFNHYLTSVATEYVPDTDRMLFYIGFGGDGFKKVYNCPLRRRPVSESVDAEDLIVSNAATDLQNCPRVTHKIKMRRSTLRRMQILKVYLDIDLDLPRNKGAEKTPVDQAKDALIGVNPVLQRPEDSDYEIYECYCELDLDEFAPKQFKGKKLPLPYRVTLEKESRKILDIRRNWPEDDEECLAKQYFVQFPFIRGLGFYGLGFIHLLGNTTSALTASWRLLLDSGMFANFPGFIYSKGLGRQNTNMFRVPPGGGVGFDVGAQQRIQDAVMPMPYKESGPSFTAFIQHVEEVGKELGSCANIQVGEGKQDAPVGTTLALIEQSAKVLDSAHKRLHAAQAEEFKLLKERFREDPEAFWRHNKRPAVEWERDLFLRALDENTIVPVADPNNPTQLHRLAKATMIGQLAMTSPELYDPIAVHLRILQTADIDPTGLFKAQAAPPPPDPRFEAIQQKAQQSQQQNQIQAQEAQAKAQLGFAQLADKEKDRAAKLQVETLKLKEQQEKTHMENIIHAQDAARDAQRDQQEMQMDAAQRGQEMHMDAAQKQQELQQDAIRHNMEMQQTSQQHQHDMAMRQHEAATDAHAQQQQMQMDAEGGRIKMQHESAMQEHDLAHTQKQRDMEMQHSEQSHQADLQRAQAMSEQKVQATKQMAAAKPKPAGQTGKTSKKGNGKKSP